MSARGEVTVQPPTEADLHEIVRRCVAGDEAAWEALDGHCRRVLPAAVRSFALPADWIGEMVPDFLCSLFADRCRALQTYQPRPGARFDSWLKVCFRHFALRWIRRRPIPHADPSADPLEVIEANAAPPCGDPHLLLGFERVVERLGERDRRLLSLRLCGFLHSEIAERLGMREGAVAVAMQRLRERLRALLVVEVLDLGLPGTSSGERNRPRGE